MVHESRLGREFFAALAELDGRIAREVAAAGCRLCGGPLHRADYERKPRGGLVAAVAEAFTRRHSLCCGREGCRARALPPSLRFLGRRVYVEAVVLLASVITQMAATPRAARASTGVPTRTLRRWGSWWTGLFPLTSTWTELRARIVPPPPDEGDLPRSFVERLGVIVEQERGSPTLADVCELAARCLASATTTSVPDGSRFLRAIFGRVALG